MLPVLLLAGWLATATPWAAAQASVSTPAPLAPADARRAPQRLSPDAERDSATAPGSLRPERAALPQLTVPVGKPPAQAAAAAAGALPPKPSASAGGVSDAVARCEATTSTVERKACRRQLAIQAPVAR
ncbi:MAG: hypothetical protein QE285_00455 [Aquabacterium sp.]|nr:hypothetical protein [Aquabacterium sp.]